MRISDWSSDVCSSDLIDGGSRLDKVVGHESPSLFSASRVCARRRHRAARAMGAGRAMNRRGPGKLRVIGGEWRSRVIERSEEHTSELQSLMRNSYAVFCLKIKKQKTQK